MKVLRHCEGASAMQTAELSIKKEASADKRSLTLLN